MMLPFCTPLNFTDIQKILFLRKDNLGDLLYTLPLTTLLKQHYPQLRIDFLVPAYSAPLAQYYADADQVLILPDGIKPSGDAYRSTVDLIKAQHYDLAFNIHPKFVLAKLAFAARIPHRLTRTERLYTLYANHWVWQQRKHQRQHELDYNLDLLHGCINPPDRQAIPFNFQTSAAAAAKVETFLQQHQIRHFTLIHPGSNGSAIDLPLNLYGDLIDAYPLPGAVIITGTAKESPLYQQLSRHCRKPLIDATGQFSLEELLCLIQRCTLLISNSTGPLHIARAFNKPLLGFYSTLKSAHPRRWGPYGQEQSHTLIPANENFATFQTNLKQCRANMAAIKVTDIMRKLDAILAEPTRCQPT
ncbi:glycosyltransferase family 9 protein [Methylovulum psychrotolerans]|uniref:glycosyltransferase family 9 protein n=1 Tax=Methylovulum psychrotolerans TaxID=1704499 RepID=UPI001BFF3642|nr:glycosyltransferase family 9 protein [Methylovulum psychrotolerans]MBT9096744.1 glycosyltransferase family 9 protein [Methylovulum psychrotolerans]